MTTTKLINYLSQNKRRISRFLYLAAALVEQLPDPDLPKMVLGRTINLVDQLTGDGSPSSRKKRNGKRTVRK